MNEEIVTSGNSWEVANGHARNMTPESKLQDSREEFEELFAEDEQRPPFQPRSKIMRSLTGKGGIALLAVGVGVLLIAKPGLAAKAARVVPRLLPTGSLWSLALNTFLRKSR